VYTFIICRNDVCSPILIKQVVFYTIRIKNQLRWLRWFSEEINLLRWNFVSLFWDFKTTKYDHEKRTWVFISWYDYDKLKICNIKKNFKCYLQLFTGPCSIWEEWEEIKQQWSLNCGCMYRGRTENFKVQWSIMQHHNNVWNQNMAVWPRDS